MAQLYLFRHGQSKDNLNHIFSGKRDADLSEQGEKEAKKIGVQLKNITPTFAYDSGQLRAKRTLEIALGDKFQNIKVIHDERIRERDYGDLTGQNKEEIAKKYPDQYPLWHRSYDVPPPNGESVKDVEERVMKFLEEEKIKWKENDIIFISCHGNSLRPFRKHFEGLTNDEMASFEHTPAKVYHYQL